MRDHVYLPVQENYAPVGVAAGDPRRKTGERRVYRVATRHRGEHESEEERARVKDTWGRERNRDWLNRSRKSPPGCSTGRHFAQFSTALRVKRSFRIISSLSLSLAAIDRAGSTLRSRSRASASRVLQEIVKGQGIPI